MINDGTKLYDHHHDGSTQVQGSCIRDFRNKPLPIRLKIQYINQELTVRNSINKNNLLFSSSIFSLY
jgi:mannose-binding lectin 1